MGLLCFPWGYNSSNNQPEGKSFMRRISFIRPFCLLLVAAIAVVGFALQASARGVTGVQQSPPVPSAATDPAAVFLLNAERHNGLGYPSDVAALSFKIKASFEVVAPDGGITDRGNYEEIVEDAKHLKISYQSTGFTQSKYRNGGNIRVTGSRAGMPPDPYIEMVLALYNPVGIDFRLMRALAQGAQTTIQIDLREIAGQPVRCYELTNLRLTPDHGPSATECFNAAGALVEFSFSAQPLGIATVSRTIDYQGRHVPAEVEFRRKDLPGLRIHVESIEPMNERDGASFVVPPDAVAPDPIGIHPPSSSVPAAPQTK